jgi:hypothetical protein
MGITVCNEPGWSEREGERGREESDKKGIKKKNSVNSGIGLDPGEKREKINPSKEGEKKHQGVATGENKDPKEKVRQRDIQVGGGEKKDPGSKRGI